jgi:flagellar biosynthesis protein FliP
MRIQLNKNLLIRSGLALAMTLAIWTPALSQTTEPAKAKKMEMEGKTKEHSQMMQEHCKAMMADMKAQDAELTAQVARMNSAPRESKMDLMAEIITKMAEQRVAMNVRMGQMHMEMMKHMQMGMGSMSHHSMMKGMDHKSEDTHKDSK